MRGCTEEQRRRGGFLRKDFDVFPENSDNRRILNNIEHASDTNKRHQKNPYRKEHDTAEVDF